LQKFEEYLNKMAVLKKEYETKQINVPGKTLAILIMAGAFDSWLKTSENEVIEITQRWAAIERLKNKLGSSFAIKPGAKGALDLGDIKDEVSRKVWRASVDPMALIKLCDCFPETLKVMGFVDQNTPNLRYRSKKVNNKGETETIDLFGSFDSLFMPQCLAYYGNKSVKTKVAVMARILGYETRSFGNEGKSFRKIKLNDGNRDDEAVIWPSWATGDFDAAMTAQLNALRGKYAMVIGKISVSARGFKSFTAERFIDVQP
jgi:hypothetical protein